MIKTTHVRAALADVIPLLEEKLAAEGLRRSERTLEPRTIEIGGETMTFAPEVPPNVRRIVVADRDGWIAIADDPFASTEWGKDLSAELGGAPVFTLEGECDHAFYSSILVHENGAEAHRSEVPRDAVHEKDGRHRVRPLFLAEYFPEARAALEAGIVVNRLGGEENVHAVGKALSIPNATLSGYEEDAEGRVELLFEYDAALGGGAKAGAKAGATGGATGMTGMQGAFAQMMGDLAANLASELDPEQLAAMGLSPEAMGGDSDAVAQAMMAQLGAMVTAGAAAQASLPLALGARLRSRWSGFAGDAFECHTTFELEGGTADGPRRSRGVTLRVSGPGVAFFEVEKVRVMPASSVGDPAAPHWEVAAKRTEDGGFVARVPEIELALPEPAAEGAEGAEGAEETSPAERLRRRMHTPVTATMAQNHAEMVVYLVGRLALAGEGKVDVTAEVTAEDGAELKATSENAVEVKAALRVPALPAWATAEHLRSHQHYLEDYDGRGWVRGWLGFDRPWAEVREIVTRMAVDLAGLLLEVGRSEPKKELVELDGKATEADIRAALERGAEVIVTGKRPMRATIDDFRPDTICLSGMSDEEGSVDDGFSAEVLRKGGERLEFPAPVAVTAKREREPEPEPEPEPATPWAQVLDELERGADVALSAGPWQEPIRIEIKHRPEGSNYFPDPARAAENVRVDLAWSCPRPNEAASARSLGRMGEDLLTRAGGVAGQLGGVSLTVGSGSMMDFETPYETLTDTRLSAKKPAWLSEHVRSPGHRVLVPEGAAKKLPAAPEGVELRTLAHGTLLLAAGEDPFTADREAMERAVLPLLGRDSEEPTG